MRDIGDFRRRSRHRAHLAIFTDRRDRRIKSPGVSPAKGKEIKDVEIIQGVQDRIPKCDLSRENVKRIKPFAIRVLSV